MKRMRGNKKRFNIFNPFWKSYQQTKLDPEKKSKSVKFGWIAIVFSLLCVGLAYPCVRFGVKAVIWTFSTHMGFFTYCLAIGHIALGALSIGVVLLPYYLWFQGIFLVGMQLGLNRKFIGWLALLIWLASVVGIVWVSYISFDTLMNQLMQ